jgi:hypothetical protein
MKNAAAESLKHGKARGSLAQATAVHFKAPANPPPSPAEDGLDLSRPLVEPLPLQFEESLSRMARRFQ